jgi:membrane fusion protein, copper/silver efflux system
MNKSTKVGSFLIVTLAAFLAGRNSVGFSHDRPTGKRILYYVDPMHPAYHSDRPGIAPDCGMVLEPVYEGEDPGAKLQLPSGAVSISPEKQQLIGVRVETVEKKPGPWFIRTTGRVEADDNRVYRLMAATEGWVQSLENNPAGTMVNKNGLLATFYSREFRNVEQAYLGSLASLERLKINPEQNEQNRMGDANLRTNEEQLRALGMGEPQIKEMAKTHQTTRDIAVTSPVDGVVLSRGISPEQRFEKGAELYRIADLSKVWILADIYGDEAKMLRPGTRVKVTARGLAKTLYASVTENPPLFDPASRTLKLRLQADNPGSLLRPDMFVDLEFNTNVPPGLSVPEEAVLDSGLQKIVYLETNEGIFEQRPVEIGTAYGARLTITRGLAEGDRVVTSGNFLIDSESRMRSSARVGSGAKQDAKQESNRDVVAMRDPVCGMSMDPNPAQSGGHVEKYHGETLVFCSEKCQKEFRLDPARYAGEKVRSTAVLQRALGRGDD